MLDTLLKIGGWQAEGKSPWDRFLDYPTIQTEDKKGNSITNYTLPILFDLDERRVIVDRSYLKEYEENDVSRLKAIRIKGGNNKANYVTVPSGKLIQLSKTLFGIAKSGKEPTTGEVIESIEKTDLSLLTNKLQEIFGEIFSLKDEFLAIVNPENDDKFPIKYIEQILGLAFSERLVLLNIMIKSQKHGFPEPVYFSEIPDYKQVLERQYFGDQEIDLISKKNSNEKLCYASGNIDEGVEELNLNTRYSLNKMFVTETKNYASSFSDKNFYKNYQVSKANQEKLDYASDFLLNHGFKVRIANIDHVIIPQVKFGADIDWEMALDWTKKQSDILFQFNALDSLSKTIEDETEDVFWINFVAFESDGNFFKSTEVIKDVSRFYFSKVIEVFVDVHAEFREVDFVNWNTVMIKGFFNLNTVYGLIPLRKDKEKKNKALDLFKAILENRKVQLDILYDYFKELILCHWYERYGSYTNVYPSSKDYFRKSVRDSVFKYFAFIQVLKKLNLITMEENKPVSGVDIGIQYEEAIQNFFDRMEIQKDEHKAMFYLGRILNRVEWLQFKKKIKKTVIHLVNFNGLDESDIERLYENLFNKARQHNGVGAIKDLSSQFHNHFKRENWSLNPKESLFYLLSGYSFMVKKEEAEEQYKVEKEED